MSGFNTGMKRLLNCDENAAITASEHGELAGPVPGMVDLPDTPKKTDSSVDDVSLSPAAIDKNPDLFGYRAGHWPSRAWTEALCSASSGVRGPRDRARGERGPGAGARR